MTGRWKVSQGNDKGPRWEAAVLRGQKGGCPEFLVNICKIMVTYGQIWANWMLILPWNTNSYESRSLCLMDFTGSLVILFLCIYFNKYHTPLKEGISMQGTCVQPFFWSSRFTCAERFMPFIFRWGSGAQGGATLGPGMRGWGGDVIEALPLLPGPSFYLNPTQQ